MLTRWPLAVVSIAALLSSILSGHTLYTTYRWSRLYQIYHRLCFHNVIIMFIMVLILLLITMMMKLMITHRRPSVVMSTEVSDSLRWGDTQLVTQQDVLSLLHWDLYIDHLFLTSREQRNIVQLCTRRYQTLKKHRNYPDCNLIKKCLKSDYKSKKWETIDKN